MSLWALCRWSNIVFGATGAPKEKQQQLTWLSSHERMDHNVHAVRTNCRTTKTIDTYFLNECLSFDCFWSFEKTLNLNAVDGRNLAPVDNSSLSHYLQSFKNIPGGCLGFLNHQQYQHACSKWNSLLRSVTSAFFSQWLVGDLSEVPSKRDRNFSKMELACLGPGAAPNHQKIVERCVFFFKWGIVRRQLYEVQVLEGFLDILWVSEE